MYKFSPSYSDSVGTGMVGLVEGVAPDGAPLQSTAGELLSHPCWQAGTYPAEIQGASLSPYGLSGVSVLVWVAPFIQPEAVPVDTGPHRKRWKSGGRIIPGDGVRQC